MSWRSCGESLAVDNAQFLTKWGGWSRREIKTCLSFCCMNLYSNFICGVWFSFIWFPVWRDLSRIDNPNFEHKSLGCAADRCFALSYDNGWLEAGRENARGLSLQSSIRRVCGWLREGEGAAWGGAVLCLFICLFILNIWTQAEMLRDVSGNLGNRGLPRHHTTRWGQTSSMDVRGSAARSAQGSRCCSELQMVQPESEIPPTETWGCQRAIKWHPWLVNILLSLV